MSDLPIDRYVDAVKASLERHAWGPMRVQGAWRELQLRREQDVLRDRRMRTVGVPALALAAAFSLLVGAWAMFGSGDIRTATKPAPGFEHRLVSDGIEAEVERSVVLELKERNDARVVVAVGTGKSRFRVRHDPKRVFRVQAGDVTIEDLGTRFEVAHDGNRVHVSVTEGAVSVAFPRVDGAGRGSAVLTAPASGTYVATPAPAASATVPGSHPAKETAAPATSAAEPSALRGAPASSSWRELARGGKHRSAYDLLAPSGFRDVKDEPGDLLLAADAARLSHHPAEAAGLLRKLLARHDRDPRAPSVAFQLGWLLMKDLGRPREAAVAFARAEALAPRGNLAEDAVARAIEAWHRAGETARARAEVNRYRASYPRGRHLAMLERLVAAP